MDRFGQMKLKRDLVVAAKASTIWMDANIMLKWLVAKVSGRNGLLPGDPVKYWEALQILLELRVKP